MSNEEAAVQESAPEVSEPQREAAPAGDEPAQQPEKTYTVEEFQLAERRRQSALARAKQAEDEAEKYRRRAEELEQSDLQKSLSLEKQEREKWEQVAKNAAKELRMTKITHGAIKAGATDEKSVAIAIQGLMASGTLDSDSEDADAVIQLLKQEMPVLFKGPGDGGGAEQAKVPARGAKPPEPEAPGKKYVDDLKKRDPRAASFFFGPGE